MSYEIIVQKLTRKRWHTATCGKCGEVLLSEYRHDFHYCHCGYTFIDGGRDYIRCGYGKGEPNPSKPKMSYTIVDCIDNRYEIELDPVLVSKLK